VSEVQVHVLQYPMATPHTDSITGTAVM